MFSYIYLTSALLEICRSFIPFFFFLVVLSSFLKFKSSLYILDKKLYKIGIISLVCSIEITSDIVWAAYLLFWKVINYRLNFLIDIELFQLSGSSCYEFLQICLQEFGLFHLGYQTYGNRVIHNIPLLSFQYPMGSVEMHVCSPHPFIPNISHLCPLSLLVNLAWGLSISCEITQVFSVLYFWFNSICLRADTVWFQNFILLNCILWPRMWSTMVNAHESLRIMCILLLLDGIVYR